CRYAELDPQALERDWDAAARDVLGSAAHRSDHGALRGSLWQPVFAAADRAGARLLRALVGQVFRRLLRGQGSRGASRGRPTPLIRAAGGVWNPAPTYCGLLGNRRHSRVL